MALCLQNISKFFASPLSKAAQELGTCPATLKRTCRHLGIKRWPYRLMRAVERKQKLLRAGQHLTPTDLMSLRKSEKELIEFRTSILSEVSSIPKLDKICAYASGTAKATQSTIPAAQVVYDNFGTMQPPVLHSSSVFFPEMRFSIPLIPSNRNGVCASYVADCTIKQILYRCFLPR